MTQRIESQVARFAPGFQDRIAARHTMGPSEMEAYNPNYIGGDITGGVQSFPQLFVRPLGTMECVFHTSTRIVPLLEAQCRPAPAFTVCAGISPRERALREVLS